MIISKIELFNWKNFHRCEVGVQERCFVVGANAAGKSNFIDALRFLRDVAKQGGGLQTAVRVRGGITKIRCLAAREQSNVKLAIELSESDSRELCWHYELFLRKFFRGENSAMYWIVRLKPWERMKKH